MNAVCAAITKAERADWYRVTSPPLDAPDGVLEITVADYRLRLRTCTDAADCLSRGCVEFCGDEVMRDVARERCIRWDSVKAVCVPGRPCPPDMSIRPEYV